MHFPKSFFQTAANSSRQSLFLLVFCCFGTSLFAQPWTQLGAALIGASAGEQAGYSVALSADGLTAAVGSPYNDDNGQDCGQVRVYKLVNEVWTQLGEALNGEAATDRFGWSVSLSADGQTLAAGAPFNDGNGSASGHVRVYNLVNGSWVKYAYDINGESASDQSGYSVSLSDDGLKLAVGSPYNTGDGSGSGQVRVYELITGLWLLLGPEINGESGGEQAGYAVSLSADGHTVAVGAPTNSATGTQTGRVRVYKELNGAWSKQGQDMVGVVFSELGFSVSLSDDGLTVAAGAPYDDTGAINSGQTRVYQLSNNTWVQQGGSIFGEASGDQSGSAVSLSADGLSLAIGAFRNNGGGEASGHARVFKWVNGAWAKQQQDIDGPAAFDLAGSSLCLSADGLTLAVGVPQSDANGVNSGQLRVYTRWYLPEANLKGGGFDIQDGDNSPSTNDLTAFGTVNLGSNLLHTFALQNIGHSNLTVSNITSNNTRFSVGPLLPASPIAGESSATFTLTFTPDATGAQSATITITNNDSDENPYTFTVNGNSVCPTLSFNPIASASCANANEGTVAIGGVTGGTSPYAYSKDNGATYQSSGLFSDLAVGSYSMVVKDAFGCVSSPKTAVVNPVPGPVCIINAPDDVCTGAAGISVSTVSGLSSYQWSISGNGTISGPTNTSSILVNAGAGTGTFTVSLTVSGAGGCISECFRTVNVQTCNIEFSGKILFSSNNSLGVNNATVSLSGSATGADVTEGNGDFSIPTALSTGSFVLTPTKTINKLNGVTAADASRIQQHVSQINPITDPYKLVAADVNKSNSVTTLDASIINQALLGSPTALGQIKTSWRFVPTSHLMANPPWGFPEQRSYTNVVGNQTQQDFYGIKTGDVTEDFANPANANGGSTRPFLLSAKDEILREGADLWVEFGAAAFEDLAAVQFGLRFDPARLACVEVQPGTALPLTSENFGLYELTEGAIRAAWSQAAGLAVPEAAPVFRLRFKVLQGGVQLSAALQLDEALLPPLAFTSDLAGSALGLRFTEVSATEGPSATSGLYLLQNRPNPFSGTTAIGFELPESAAVQLRILDATGRVLAERKAFYPSGKSEERFELEGASGVLWYELTTPFGTLTRKMISVE